MPYYGHERQIFNMIWKTSNESVADNASMDSDHLIGSRTRSKIAAACLKLWLQFVASCAPGCLLLGVVGIVSHMHPNYISCAYLIVVCITFLLEQRLFDTPPTNRRVCRSMSSARDDYVLLGDNESMETDASRSRWRWEVVTVMLLFYHSSSVSHTYNGSIVNRRPLS